jgi:hypothetical protein
MIWYHNVACHMCPPPARSTVVRIEEARTIAAIFPGGLKVVRGQSPPERIMLHLTQQLKIPSPWLFEAGLVRGSIVGNKSCMSS